MAFGKAIDTFNVFIWFCFPFGTRLFREYSTQSTDLGVEKLLQQR